MYLVYNNIRYKSNSNIIFDRVSLREIKCLRDAFNYGNICDLDSFNGTLIYTDKDIYDEFVLDNTVKYFDIGQDIGCTYPKKYKNSVFYDESIEETIKDRFDEKPLVRVDFSIKTSYYPFGLRYLEHVFDIDTLKLVSRLESSNFTDFIFVEQFYYKCNPHTKLVPFIKPWNPETQSVSINKYSLSNCKLRTETVDVKCSYKEYVDNIESFISFVNNSTDEIKKDGHISKVLDFIKTKSSNNNN